MTIFSILSFACVAGLEKSHQHHQVPHHRLHHSLEELEDKNTAAEHEFEGKNNKLLRRHNYHHQEHHHPTDVANAMVEIGNSEEQAIKRAVEKDMKSEDADDEKSDSNKDASTSLIEGGEHGTPVWTSEDYMTAMTEQHPDFYPMHDQVAREARKIVHEAQAFEQDKKLQVINKDKTLDAVTTDKPKENTITYTGTNLKPFHSKNDCRLGTLWNRDQEFSCVPSSNKPVEGCQDATELCTTWGDAHHEYFRKIFNNEDDYTRETERAVTQTVKVQRDQDTGAEVELYSDERDDDDKSLTPFALAKKKSYQTCWEARAGWVGHFSQFVCDNWGRYEAYNKQMDPFRAKKEEDEMGKQEKADAAKRAARERIKAEEASLPWHQRYLNEMKRAEEDQVQDWKERMQGELRQHRIEDYNGPLIEGLDHTPNTDYYFGWAWHQCNSERIGFVASGPPVSLRKGSLGFPPYTPAGWVCDIAAETDDADADSPDVGTDGDVPLGLAAISKSGNGTSGNPSPAGAPATSKAALSLVESNTSSGVVSTWGADPDTPKEQRSFPRWYQCKKDTNGWRSSNKVAACTYSDSMIAYGQESHGFFVWAQCNYSNRGAGAGGPQSNHFKCVCEKIDKTEFVASRQCKSWQWVVCTEEGASAGCRQGSCCEYEVGVHSGRPNWRWSSLIRAATVPPSFLEVDAFGQVTDTREHNTDTKYYTAAEKAKKEKEQNQKPWDMSVDMSDLQSSESKENAKHTKLASDSLITKTNRQMDSRTFDSVKREVAGDNSDSFIQKSAPKMTDEQKDEAEDNKTLAETEKIINDSKVKLGSSYVDTTPKVIGDDSGSVSTVETRSQVEYTPKDVSSQTQYLVQKGAAVEALNAPDGIEVVPKVIRQDTEKIEARAEALREAMNVAQAHHGTLNS